MDHLTLEKLQAISRRLKIRIWIMVAAGLIGITGAIAVNMNEPKLSSVCFSAVSAILWCLLATMRKSDCPE